MRQRTRSAIVPPCWRGGLVGDRTNLVTFVAGCMVDPFDAIFLDCFSKTLAERGIRLLLASATPSKPNDSGLMQALDYQVGSGRCF